MARLASPSIVSPRAATFTENPSATHLVGAEGTRPLLSLCRIVQIQEHTRHRLRATWLCTARVAVCGPCATARPASRGVACVAPECQLHQLSPTTHRRYISALCTWIACRWLRLVTLQRLLHVWQDHVVGNKTAMRQTVRSGCNSGVFLSTMAWTVQGPCMSATLSVMAHASQHRGVRHARTCTCPWRRHSRSCCIHGMSSRWISSRSFLCGTGWMRSSRCCTSYTYPVSLGSPCVHG